MALRQAKPLPDKEHLEEQFMSRINSAAPLPRDNNPVYPLVSMIFAYCMVDADFRRLVLSDPDRAIHSLGGEPLPHNVRLQFIDNSGPTKTISYILPDPLPLAELCESDLTTIAGGEAAFGGDGNNLPITGCCITFN
jgi:hypothetical protein